MKKLTLAFALALTCAAAARADQGCIETSSVTVTATICSQFDCIQRSGGNCVNWACTRTQTSKYLDSAATGCTPAASNANHGGRPMRTASTAAQSSSRLISLGSASSSSSQSLGPWQ